MRVSISDFYKRFQAWLARRDNPTDVTPAQIGAYTTSEMQTKLDQLMVNNQFPIDRVGDTSFFPISIDGSYDATSRRNSQNRGNSCVEVDGSISFIGSYTNGLSFGLYMFRLVINAVGVISEVEPKSGRYQNAKMKELGFIPTVMTYNDADHILVMRDDRYYQPDAANELQTRVRIVRTNGTMNPDNHSCSWLSESFYNLNCVFTIVGTKGYMFEIKSSDMTMTVWTFDPSRIGIDDTIKPELIGKDITTKGFYGNQFTKMNSIKWANTYLTTNADVKASYAMAKATTIDSGVDTILSSMVIITKHPTKNTLRLLIVHRIYINKTGWTSYYFPSYTIDFDLDTLTAEVDPVAYSDNPSINTNFGNTSAAVRTGLLVTDIFTNTGIHASHGCGYHPNGTLYRIQTSNEGEFSYDSRQHPDRLKYSLFEIYGRTRYDSLMSGGTSSGRSIARRKPFLVGDNFRNLFMLDRDVYRFISRTTSATLGSETSWIAVKLNNDNFNYLYSDYDHMGKHVIGVEPQTTRRYVTNGDNSFINVVTFGKNGFYDNNAWVFSSRGTESQWTTRRSNLSYKDNGLHTASIWDVMNSAGTATISRAEITAHVRNLIDSGVINETVNGEIVEPTWSLTVSGDPELPAILNVLFKGRNGIGVRDYVLQTRYSKSGDINGAVTIGDLVHESAIYEGYSPSANTGTTSNNPIVTSAPHTNLFVYIPEVNAWYIKYSGIFQRSPNGSTLSIDIVYKDGRMRNKSATVNDPWMQGQTHAFYHPSVGILKNAAGEAPSYGNAIGLYTRLSVDATGNLYSAPEDANTRWCLIMQQTLDSWKVILPDAIPVTFRGRQYEVEAGVEFDLMKLYPNAYVNSEFIIYVEEINESSVQVKITNNTALKETASLIIIGGATTDASKVSSTFSDKVTRFGGMNLSRTRKRNAILVTNGPYFGNPDIQGWSINRDSSLPMPQPWIDYKTDFSASNAANIINNPDEFSFGQQTDITFTFTGALTEPVSEIEFEFDIKEYDEDSEATTIYGYYLLPDGTQFDMGHGIGKIRTGLVKCNFKVGDTITLKWIGKRDTGGNYIHIYYNRPGLRIINARR